MIAIRVLPHDARQGRRASREDEEGWFTTCRVGGGAEITLSGLFVDYVDNPESSAENVGPEGIQGDVRREQS